MPSDDSSASGKPSFIVKADSDHLLKGVTSTAPTMEALMEGLKKQQTMEGLRFKTAWLDEMSQQKEDYSRYEQLAAAMGISSQAAHDLTNAFMKYAEADKPRPTPNVDLDKMLDELEGWVTTFREELPADPISRAAELIVRGDETAEFLTVVLGDLLEQARGRAWVETVVLDFTVEYQSERENFVCRTTTRRRPAPQKGSWIQAVVPRPVVEEGLMPMAVLEDADQRLKLRTLLLAMARDVAVGPGEYRALLPSRRMYEEPCL